MSEECQPQSKSHVSRWVLGIVAVLVALVIYPLSMGPVVALSMKYHASAAHFERVSVFYLPVTRGCIRTGKLEFMESYVRWWESQLGANFMQLPEGKSRP